MSIFRISVSFKLFYSEKQNASVSEANETVTHLTGVYWLQRLFNHSLTVSFIHFKVLQLKIF